MKSSRYAEAGIPQYWIVDPFCVDSPQPAVEVYDLYDAGTYQFAARSEGEEQISVTAPIPVTVAPKWIYCDALSPRGAL